MELQQENNAAGLVAARRKLNQYLCSGDNILKAYNRREVGISNFDVEVRSKVRKSWEKFIL
ncbi:hypothetical protein RG47T_5182 [Mucilaginibacter polytrichastri]|uniref:Uncharacterized protein n=1 Tax=Mucilaginibacter polytrichastri TaxID=1302689 RepID=A0A1Q6A6Q2_9SPHI|nr:hypothetical protein RG47T_5182 [Mucilaginibacter polytrichastri]